ncbi:unnamed protein product [Prunus armeniaca]|uniref:Uncharacterized protein n=1 Tax=Prunus armeniaca TaxID=36596 RepID=A0A6J5UBK1_PRUAR|nr:unnamed protein product [Prunus armeniaca]
MAGNFPGRNRGREIVRDDIAHVVVVISSSATATVDKDERSSNCVPNSKSNLFISTHSSDLDLQRRMEGMHESWCCIRQKFDGMHLPW